MFFGAFLVVAKNSLWGVDRGFGMVGGWVGGWRGAGMVFGWLVVSGTCRGGPAIIPDDTRPTRSSEKLSSE